MSPSKKTTATTGKRPIIADYEGYKPGTIAFLQKIGAKVWSKIHIENEYGKTEGIILPRNKFALDNFLEIKLKNGYNIGIPLTESTQITVLSQEPRMEVKFEQSIHPKNPLLPNLVLLGTGGTISSRLDYVTGAVIPAFSPGELFTAVPELAEICNLETEVVFKILSENIKPTYWLTMAQHVVKIANSGNQGVIVAHGTDTMSYTSAALSFLLKNLHIPVVLVGSQRSSDRPSSDAAINLLHAACVASHGDIAEVVVCMLGSSAHDYGFIHRGTHVRKMHSSARHAFRSIGISPLGMVKHDQITYFTSDYRHRTQNKEENALKPTEAYSKIEEKVGLVYAYPGMPSDLLDVYVDKGYKGIVLAGTGLGHVPQELYPSIRRTADAGIPMVMTVQTLWGFTGMDVYETGRELQSLGIIPGQNMLPETALAKLAWILGNFSDPQEITRLITTNVAGEIASCESMNGYNILQGIESRIEKERN